MEPTEPKLHPAQSEADEDDDDEEDFLDDVPFEFETKSMRDLEVEHFDYGLTSSEQDWVDENTRAILEQLGFEDIDGLYDELAAFDLFSNDDMAGSGNLLSMFGFDENFEEEYAKISEEFELALAEGDTEKEEQLRGELRELLQESYYDMLGDEVSSLSPTEKMNFDMEIQENADVLLDILAEIGRIERGELEYEDSQLAGILEELGLQIDEFD